MANPKIELQPFVAREALLAATDLRMTFGSLVHTALLVGIQVLRSEKAALLDSKGSGLAPAEMRNSPELDPDFLAALAKVKRKEP